MRRRSHFVPLATLTRIYLHAVWNDAVHVLSFTVNIRLISPSINVRYTRAIATHVAHHPFHLFDTSTNHRITRAELAQNIAAALKSWTTCPLTCTALLGTIENMVYAEFVSDYTAAGAIGKVGSRGMEGVRPYVYSAMMRAGGLLIHCDCDAHDDSGEGCSDFIASLESALSQYNISNPQYQVPVPASLAAIRNLIRENRAHAAIPAHMVREKIELLGQYAILSHRWERPAGRELHFTDIEETSTTHSDQGDKDGPRRVHPSSHPTTPTKAVAVRTSSERAPRPSLPLPCEASRKKGWDKLDGFRSVVESRYGCRYLWMDTFCIGEADRTESIRRMLGWYRRAYVCVVYLRRRSKPSTSTATAMTPLTFNAIANDTTVRRSSWWARGWTLQEFLAPNRMECFAKDWTPLDGMGPLQKSRSRLDVLRETMLTSDVGGTHYQ